MKHISEVRDPRWGIIPRMLSEFNDAPTTEQFNNNYAHGGGWMPFKGFTLRQDGAKFWLEYPEDPDTQMVDAAKFRDDIIILFQHEWVGVLNSENEFQVSRMD